MDQVTLTAQVDAAESTVTVTASPDAGGQLLTVPAGALSVSGCVAALPVRLKWRIGTSGSWAMIDGGECFTVSGPSSANVYVAKQSAASAPVSLVITVRTAGEVMAGPAAAPVVTYSETDAGRVEFSLPSGDTLDATGLLSGVLIADGGSGVSSGWLAAPAFAVRYGLQLSVATGGAAASLTLDGSSDGVTSAAQIATASLDELGVTSITPPIKPIYPYYRWTIVGAGAGNVKIFAGV
jgi:hypothetical protein